MSKVDKFFDQLDQLADKVIPSLEKMHYPGKPDSASPSADDAEVVSQETIIKLGYVTGPDGRGSYHHLFRGMSYITVCSVELRGRVLSQSPPGFIGNICSRCLMTLIAHQAQSMKELTDGSAR